MVSQDQGHRMAVNLHLNCSKGVGFDVYSDMINKMVAC